MSTIVSEHQSKSVEMPKEKVRGRGRKADERASVKTKEFLAEVIFNPTLETPLQFAVWRSGELTIEPNLLIAGRHITPPHDANGIVEKGVVLLPSEVAVIGSQQELLADLRAFVHRYIDVPNQWEEIVVHYVLMTWVFDCFTALPYLRFLGEAGTGKSRLLQICAHLCYRGISAGGSTTASPMFRLIELYGGTLALDEADFKNTEAWADIIKILNSGYMRGTPVIRSEKVGDSYEPRTYDVFGPKVIANRSRFADYALETRCITYETQERSPRRDIPRQLPDAFFEEARELRNKLLRWRFENYIRIKPQESELLHLEPRLAQIGTPIYSVSEDPGFQQRLLAFLAQSGAEQRSERPQAVVVEALSRLKSPKVTTLTVGVVANEARQVALGSGTASEEFTNRRVGSLIRSMGIQPRKSRDGYRLEVTEEKLAELAKRYGIALDSVNVVNV